MLLGVLVPSWFKIQIETLSQYFRLRFEKENCNRKGDHYEYQPVHKYIIGDTQVFILFCQYNAQEINVFDHTVIQIIPAVQHFFHGPFILLQVHIIEIAKEQKVDLFVLNVFRAKSP